MPKIDNIIQNIPNWMAIRNNPESNGYKFLSTFGLELDDVTGVLDELNKNMYIATADVTVPDYIYKISLEQLKDSPDILIIESSIPMVTSIYSLFKSEVMTGMFDDNKKIFYVENYVEGSDINIEVYSALIGEDGQVQYDDEDNLIKNSVILTTSQKPSLHHIWNCFDEFALLLGISRLPEERNEQLRRRIISAVSMPPGSNNTSLIAAVSRDLGINAATIDIKGLSDIEVYDNKNHLSSDFLTYLKELKNVQGLLIPKWDTEIIDESILSIEYVPRLYTDILSNIKAEHIKSGIGDLDDLLIEAPGKVSDTQEFIASIGLMADKQLTSDVYPRHDFQMIVDATGTISKELHEPKDISFSIAASENKQIGFKVEATQGYQNDLVIPSTVIRDSTVVLTGGIPSQTLGSKSSSVDFVPSNTLFHYNEQLVRVSVKLTASEDKVSAPAVSAMKINYINKNASTGFVNVDLTLSQDNVKNDAGVLTIQKGQYYNTFEYKKEFLEGGTPDDTIVLGTVSGIYLPASN